MIYSKQIRKATVFLLCSCTFLILSGCKINGGEKQMLRYTLTGHTQDIPDHTMLFLTNVLSNQTKDSMEVVGNHFSVEGMLETSPEHYYLYSADYTYAKSLWLEPGHITFDASGVAFDQAKVEGSQTQKEAEPFFNAISKAQTDQEVEELAVQFIKEYPANRMSASMLAGYAPNLGKEKVKALYEQLSPSNQQSIYGVRVKQYIDVNKSHEPGDPYSDFQMNSMNGDTVRLSDLLGKVTLLEFWASWCGPCRQQNPALVKTFRAYQSKGLSIVSVSLDFSREDWLKAIRQDSLNWHHVSDLKGRNSLAGLMYGVNTIPDNFLIDADGNIIGRALRDNALAAAIEEQLKD